MLGPLVRVILGALLFALCIRSRFVLEDNKDRWIISGYIGILLFGWGLHGLVEHLNR